MAGSEKKGPALADLERERQKFLQEESRERIRRFRDSIDLEDSIITVVTRAPESRRSLAPKGAKGWSVAIVSILVALAALAKAVSEVLK